MPRHELRLVGTDLHTQQKVVGDTHDVFVAIAAVGISCLAHQYCSMQSTLLVRQQISFLSWWLIEHLPTLRKLASKVEFQASVSSIPLCPAAKVCGVLVSWVFACGSSGQPKTMIMAYIIQRGGSGSF